MITKLLHCEHCIYKVEHIAGGGIELSPILFALGWTSRQQFEETWAALLGVISSPPLPDTVSTEVCFTPRLKTTPLEANLS